MTAVPTAPADAATGELAAARWTRWAWALLVASSAVYFLADNEADNDLWVHLLIGRQILVAGALPRLDDLSYTASGAPWINHEWLTQGVFAAWFALTGDTGLWLLKLGCGLLTAWAVWLAVARCSQSPGIRGAVMVLALAVLGRGFAVRPQIITYMGLAALLAWLATAGAANGRERNTWKLIAGTAVLFLVWANAHGGFVVGLGVLALFAVSPPWHGRSWRWAMLLAAVIAACVNPYGPELFGYIWNELYTSHPLTEWQAVAVGDPAHLPFLIMFVALVLTLPFARTLWQQPWWALLLAIVALMSFRHQRHTPLFALCAAAPLADQLDAAYAWARRRTAFRFSSFATVTLSIGLLALAATQLVLLTQRLWHDRLGIVYSASEYPVGAVRFLRRTHMSGNLALPLDWGGYLLWHATPAIRVSLDGRFATVYPSQVVEDNFTFFRGDRSRTATRMLEEYPTTMVLAPRGVATPVHGHPDWHMLYHDDVAALFATGAHGPTVVGDAPRGRIPFP